MNTPTPVAVQQTAVIQVGSPKSVVGAVLLALFFGPLGMLYATVPGALIMFLINIPLAIATLGLGLLITLPICAIWAGVAASSYNSRLGFATQHTAMMGAVAAPAAPAEWHPDPEGGDRLRYFDGHRWTDHYSQQSPQLEEPAADPDEAKTQVVEAEVEAPTAVVEAESQGAQQLFCGSCGNSISPSARFCAACGEAQAAT